MHLHHLVVGALQVNCFLLVDKTTREAYLIDPGDNASLILRLVERSGVRVTRIINTHAHFDHVLAVPDVQARHRRHLPPARGGAGGAGLGG